MIANIREAAQGEPRLHPNGFIQLDLKSGSRLHVWPAQPIPAQKTSHPVHDHVFEMESEVLKGTLENRTYKWVHCAWQDDASHELYEIVRLRGEDTILKSLWPRMSSGLIRLEMTEMVSEGEMYGLGAGILHESVPHGTVVTLMRKLKVFGGNPRVAVPVTVQPDNDFRRDQVDPAVLWELIDEAAA